MGDEAAKWRGGGCFFVSAGGAPLVAVRMKNKLSSMIVFHHSFTHLIHDSLRFCFVSSFSSFAHSARPGCKVEILGRSREGHNHRYLNAGARNSTARTKVCCVQRWDGPVV